MTFIYIKGNNKIIHPIANAIPNIIVDTTFFDVTIVFIALILFVSNGNYKNIDNDKNGIFENENYELVKNSKLFIFVAFVEIYENDINENIKKDLIVSNQILIVNF